MKPSNPEKPNKPEIPQPPTPPAALNKQPAISKGPPKNSQTRSRAYTISTPGQAAVVKGALALEDQEKQELEALKEKQAKRREEKEKTLQQLQQDLQSTSSKPIDKKPSTEAITTVVTTQSGTASFRPASTHPLQPSADLAKLAAEKVQQRKNQKNTEIRTTSKANLKPSTSQQNLNSISSPSPENVPNIATQPVGGRVGKPAAHQRSISQPVLPGLTGAKKLPGLPPRPVATSITADTTLKPTTSNEDKSNSNSDSSLPLSNENPVITPPTISKPINTSEIATEDRDHPLSELINTFINSFDTLGKSTVEHPLKFLSEKIIIPTFARLLKELSQRNITIDTNSLHTSISQLLQHNFTTTSDDNTSMWASLNQQLKSFSDSLQQRNTENPVNSMLESFQQMKLLLLFLENNPIINTVNFPTLKALLQGLQNPTIPAETVRTLSEKAPALTMPEPIPLENKTSPRQQSNSNLNTQTEKTTSSITPTPQPNSAEESVALNKDKTSPRQQSNVNTQTEKMPDTPLKRAINASNTLAKVPSPVSATQPEPVPVSGFWSFFSASAPAPVDEKKEPKADDPLQQNLTTAVAIFGIEKEKQRRAEHQQESIPKDLKQDSSTKQLDPKQVNLKNFTRYTNQMHEKLSTFLPELATLSDEISNNKLSLSSEAFLAHIFKLILKYDKPELQIFCGNFLKNLVQSSNSLPSAIAFYKDLQVGFFANKQHLFALFKVNVSAANDALVMAALSGYHANEEVTAIKTCFDTAIQIEEKNNPNANIFETFVAECRKQNLFNARTLIALGLTYYSLDEQKPTEHVVNCFREAIRLDKNEFSKYKESADEKLGKLAEQLFSEKTAQEPSTVVPQSQVGESSTLKM
ncbi:MAG: hypothetical protein WBE18_01155 [Gammaproteobacteria bacterium]